MNKKYILGILFFSSLWGFSEAVLGGFLYRYDVSYSSVYLTVIGLGVLTIARIYLPAIGTATAIAAFAMLYKFMNAPFFACHLLGILMMGACYDLFFNVLKLKSRAICAALTVYAGYGLFALMMTYVFRYEHWAGAGFAKVMNHVGIGGTLATIGCIVFVPLSHRFGEWLQTKQVHTADLAGAFGRAKPALVTAGMWLFAVAAFVMQYHRGQM